MKPQAIFICFAILVIAHTLMTPVLAQDTQVVVIVNQHITIERGASYDTVTLFKSEQSLQRSVNRTHCLFNPILWLKLDTIDCGNYKLPEDNSTYVNGV